MAKLKSTTIEGVLSINEPYDDPVEDSVGGIISFGERDMEFVGSEYIGIRQEIMQNFEGHADQGIIDSRIRFNLKVDNPLDTTGAPTIILGGSPIPIQTNSGTMVQPKFNIEADDIKLAGDIRSNGTLYVNKINSSGSIRGGDLYGTSLSSKDIKFSTANLTSEYNNINLNYIGGYTHTGSDGILSFNKFLNTNKYKTFVKTIKLTLLSRKTEDRSSFLVTIEPDFFYSFVEDIIDSTGAVKALVDMELSIFYPNEVSFGKVKFPYNTGSGISLGGMIDIYNPNYFISVVTMDSPGIKFYIDNPGAGKTAYAFISVSVDSFK